MIAWPRKHSHARLLQWWYVRRIMWARATWRHTMMKHKWHELAIRYLCGPAAMSRHDSNNYNLLNQYSTVPKKGTAIWGNKVSVQLLRNQSRKMFCRFVPRSRWAKEGVGVPCSMQRSPDHHQASSWECWAWLGKMTGALLADVLGHPLPVRYCRESSHR